MCLTRTVPYQPSSLGDREICLDVLFYAPCRKLQGAFLFKKVRSKLLPHADVFYLSNVYLGLSIGC